MDIIGYILTGSSIAGAFLNSRKRIEGFYIWTVGNTGWILWSLYHEIYFQTILWSVYLGLTVYGIYQWRKRG